MIVNSFFFYFKKILISNLIVSDFTRFNNGCFGRKYVNLVMLYYGMGFGDRD